MNNIPAAGSSGLRTAIAHGDGTDAQPDRAREWQEWTRASLDRGVNRAEVERQLLSNGWSSGETLAMIALARLGPAVPQAARPVEVEAPGPWNPELNNAQAWGNTVKKESGGSSDLFVGALWFMGGAGVTLFTYWAASSSPNGGHYTVAWGAMAYGGIRLFRGLCS